MSNTALVDEQVTIAVDFRTVPRPRGRRRHNYLFVYED